MPDDFDTHELLVNRINNCIYRLHLLTGAEAPQITTALFDIICSQAFIHMRKRKVPLHQRANRVSELRSLLHKALEVVVSEMAEKYLKETTSD